MPRPRFAFGTARRWMPWLWLGLVGTVGPPASAQDTLSITAVRRTTDPALAFDVVAPTGQYVRVERSGDLMTWTALQTWRSTGTNAVADFAPDDRQARFYRARQVVEPVALTGDHVPTGDGDVVVRPVNHASVVLSWNGRVVYVDPVGGATPYAGMPRADLILVTHDHSDHFNAATLSSVRGTNGIILAPRAVYNGLTTALKAASTVLTNGVSTNAFDVEVEAIPAYNGNHARGTGNGYVVTLGGTRFYFSGDTGDIPETRALAGIEVAFLCMNVPFTMTVTQAAAVVRAFQPRVVYPYHYRNQDGTFADLNALRRQVGTDLGIEVRTRKWY